MFCKQWCAHARCIGMILSLWGLMSTSLAQETSQEAKIDTLMAGQKQIMSKLDKINQQVEYVDPLAHKAFGFEFNPAFLLLASAADQTVLSGGFSLFNVDRGAEIAFPMFYQDTGSESDDYNTFIVESHYRRFLGQHQGGFYLSASMRYQYLKGREKTDQFLFINFSAPGEQTSVHKVGAGFGIGYRYFSRSGLYWGTSLTVGRFFTGTDKQIAGADMFNGKGYIDVELLKFGIAF